MDARLWQTLPSVAEERVLSFLPVPDLCRFRTVCKGWKALISSCPQFRTLWLQNVREHFGDIVARVVEDVEQLKAPRFHGWIILDLDAQRWYRIRHDVYSLERHSEDETIDLSLEGYVYADGGLVCELVLWDSANFGEPVVSVFNPLTSTNLARLPDTPEHCFADSASGELNFVADDVDDGFKVFFIYEDYFGCKCGPGASQDPEAILRHSVMPIYDSITGQWRSSTNPALPLDPVGEWPGVDHLRCTATFRGLLYVLFRSCQPLVDDTHYWLFSYNIAGDLWQDTGVHIRNTLEQFSLTQLVVSDDRLFLLTWEEASGEEHSNWDEPPVYCAHEVVLADRAIREVFQMTAARVESDFNVEQSEKPAAAEDMYSPPQIQGFGFKSSIILMSKKSGITLVYDLVSRSWSRLPSNPMMPLPPGCKLWYGKVMNLRLPASQGEKSEKPPLAGGVDGESVPP